MSGAVRSSRWVTVSVTAMVVTVGASGAALLAGSASSYGLIRSLLDRFTADGHADLFTPELFQQIVVKARLAGLALLAVGGILLWARRSLQAYAVSILEEGKALFEAGRWQLREAIRREHPTHWGVLLFIVLMGLIVRVCFLSQPMRYDEAFTFMQYASKPLVIGLSHYYPNNHLLHTFFVHLTTSVFGQAAWVIRLPAFLAGVLLVPASYLVIRRYYADQDAALLTAALIAASPILIGFSTAARGYTLFSLFFLLTLALAPYLLQHRNAAAWLSFAVLSAFGFYTIPLMLYPFGVVVMWLVLSAIGERNRRADGPLLSELLVAVALTMALTLFLYLPPIVASGVESLTTRVLSQAWTFSKEEWRESLGHLWAMWNRGLPLGINVLLMIGFFSSIIRHRRIARHRTPLLLAVAAGCVPVLLLQGIRPPERTWLFLLPLYFGLAAAGLSDLIRRATAVLKLGGSRIAAGLVSAVSVLVCVWISLNVIGTQSVAYSDDSGSGLREAERIVQFLKDELRPGDRILAKTPSEAPIEYYLHSYGLPVTYLFAGLGFTNRLFVVVKEPRQTLEQLVGPELLTSAYSPPALLKRYEVASLYEIHRRQ